MSLPKPRDNRSWETEIPMALIIMADEKIAPCSLIVSFCAQLWEMRTQNGDPAALSLLSLGFQAPVIAALAFRWLLRLGHPAWDTSKPGSISLWYQWAFPVVNYAMYAFGCMLLWASYPILGHWATESGDLEGRVSLLR